MIVASVAKQPLAVGGLGTLSTRGRRTTQGRSLQPVRTVAPQDAVEGAKASQQWRQDRQTGGVEPGRLWQSYPHIDCSFPGLEQVQRCCMSRRLCCLCCELGDTNPPRSPGTLACVACPLPALLPLQVHAEPPVYIAHGFLSNEECLGLRRAAAAGELQPLPYDNKALVDTHRLWPLVSALSCARVSFCWQGPLAQASAGHLPGQRLAPARADDSRRPWHVHSATFCISHRRPS